MSAAAAIRPRSLGLTIAATSLGFGRFGLRWPMVFGLLLGGAGYWLLGQLDATTPYAAMLPGFVLIAAGIGLAVPLMTSALLSTVPRPRSGVASGVLNTVRQAGGGIGVALFGALMAGRGMPGTQSAFVISAALLACGALAAGFGIRQRSAQPA